MDSQEVLTELRQAQPFVGIRSIVAIKDLGQAFGEKIGAITAYLRDHLLEPAGPPFVRYHSFGEEETDVEAGVPLTAPAAANGELKPGQLPGGMMLVTWHEGPDDQLGDAYARIEAARLAGGYERAGAAWEVYHWLDLSSDAAVGQSARRIELVQPITSQL